MSVDGRDAVLERDCVTHEDALAKYAIEGKLDSAFLQVGLDHV